jgi:hypothetical protein
VVGKAWSDDSDHHIHHVDPANLVDCPDVDLAEPADQAHRPREPDLMDAAAREALGRLVDGADAGLLGDARRVRGLLQDLCPQPRREVMVLVAAVEEGLPPRLRQLPAGGMVPEELGRLGAELARARGLTPEVAGWAVGAWAWALGVGPIPAEERTPTAEAERTPTAEGRAGPRPPQRPPPSLPTPEVTEDRKQSKRRRIVPLAAPIAVGLLLAAGTALVASISPQRPPPAGPTSTTRSLFQEDFSSPSGHWIAGKRREGSTEFAQGTFRFHATQPWKTLMSPLQMSPVTNDDTRVRIEVRARRQAGATDAGYGIAWRIDPTTKRFYEAEIHDDGTYVIQKWVPGHKNPRDNWRVLRSGSATTAIRSGAVNRLRLDVAGGQQQPMTVSLLVNGHELAKDVVDRREPLAPAGGVGLVAATYQHAPLMVEFDDFAVYAT